MADEAVIGEDAAQVGMALEQDAEQIEGLALEPVGAGPDTGTEATTGSSSSSQNARSGARWLC